MNLKTIVLRFKKQIFFAFVAVGCAFGVYVAFVTVDQYEIIVKAVLGLTVLYMFTIEFLSSTRVSDGSFGINILLPRDLKYVIYGFVITTILLWSSIQVLYLIWYLKSIVTSQ